MTTAAPQSTQAGSAPCPFCGSKDTELSHTESNWPAVGCNECGALGPCTDLHSDKAIEAWNTRASMQRAEVRGEWQPIATAPKDGTPVDLFSDSGRRWCNYRWDKDFHYEAWSDASCRERNWRDRPFMYASQVTHWQPLPAPPALSKPPEPTTTEVKR